MPKLYIFSAALQQWQSNLMYCILFEIIEAAMRLVSLIIYSVAHPSVILKSIVHNRSYII